MPIPRPHLAALATLSPLALALTAAPAQAQVPDYDFPWATIGSPGNAPYVGPTPDGSTVSPRGQVDYVYRMSKMEVTTAQWVEFANATAAMNEPYRIGQGPVGAYHIAGTLPNGHFTYALSNVPNAGLLPVQGITWRNAARYCNWLHNNKGNTLAALETGAYDTSTFGQALDANGFPYFTDALTHLPGAKFWIPTVNEWVKAAHYDPNRYGPGLGGYWNYSTSSDTPPIIGPESTGGQTNAGYTNYSDIPTFLLGAHPNTTSPWGLLDVSGGSQEWQEDVSSESRRYRSYDGSYAPTQFTPDSNPLDADLIYSRGSWTANSELSYIGLRVASAVPTPTSALALGVALVSFRRRRRVCG